MWPVQPQEVNPFPGQDEHETLETFFANIDLSVAERIARRCFHANGPGRPPRNPLGLLRAFIVMRMKGIRSLRELARLLDVDQRRARVFFFYGRLFFTGNVVVVVASVELTDTSKMPSWSGVINVAPYLPSGPAVAA